MKKFEIFIRSPRQRKYRVGCTLLATDIRNAAKIASDRFVGRWIKVLPAIIYV